MEPLYCSFTFFIPLPCVPPHSNWLVMVVNVLPGNCSAEGSPNGVNTTQVRALSCLTLVHRRRYSCLCIGATVIAEGRQRTLHSPAAART